MLARTKSCSGPVGLVAILVLAFTGSARAADFIRGDSNGDGAVSISDAKHLLDYLFQGRYLGCLASGDVKDDGMLNMSDGIKLLEYLILGRDPPPAPFPEPGADAQAELPCDTYGGGSPLADPGAELQVLDATAAGGDDRRATIRIACSSSNAIAGLYGAISSSAFGSVNNNDVKDLTGTADRPFGGAGVVDGRLHFGFLPDVLNPVYIPAGEDQEFIEITFCLPPDTPAGEYPMTLESGELTDAESSRAILPALSSGVLTVASQATGPDRCAVEENPPPPPVVNLEYRLENVTAGEDRNATMPFVMRASGGIQGYAFSVDFDEEVLEATSIETAWSRPDGAEYEFQVLEFDNHRNHPGSGGVDEGFLLGAAIFSFREAMAMPPDTDNVALRFHFTVRPESTAGVTEVRFLDGAHASGQPLGINNEATAFGKSYTPELADSFIFTNGRINILPDGTLFIRGDSDGSGQVDLSDAQTTLGYLFIAGSPRPACYDASDANDDGNINLTDPIATLVHLFQGGAPRDPGRGSHAGLPGLRLSRLTKRRLARAALDAATGQASETKGGIAPSTWDRATSTSASWAREARGGCSSCAISTGMPRWR